MTKADIIIGYAYKQKCLRGTGYISYGAWLAATHDEIPGYERDRWCEEISQITTVYEKWETIVENLTRPSMKALDPRNYSIYQLSRAVGINWCIRTRNSLLRKQKKVVSIITLDSLFHPLHASTKSAISHLTLHFLHVCFVDTKSRVSKRQVSRISWKSTWKWDPRWRIPLQSSGRINRRSIQRRPSGAMWKSLITVFGTDLLW